MVTVLQFNEHTYKLVLIVSYSASGIDPFLVADAKLDLAKETYSLHVIREHMHFMEYACLSD